MNYINLPCGGVMDAEAISWNNISGKPFYDNGTQNKIAYDNITITAISGGETSNSAYLTELTYNINPSSTYTVILNGIEYKNLKPIVYFGYNGIGNTNLLSEEYEPVPNELPFVIIADMIEWIGDNPTTLTIIEKYNDILKLPESVMPDGYPYHKFEYVGDIYSTTLHFERRIRDGVPYNQMGLDRDGLVWWNNVQKTLFTDEDVQKLASKENIYLSVIWDGVEYKCKSNCWGEWLDFGNSSLGEFPNGGEIGDHPTMFPISEEPFCLWLSMGMNIETNDTSTDTHTISIQRIENVIVPLDSNMLPNIVITQSSLDQNKVHYISGSFDFIKNQCLNNRPVNIYLQNEASMMLATMYEFGELWDRIIILFSYLAINNGVTSVRYICVCLDSDNNIISMEQIYPEAIN